MNRSITESTEFSLPQLPIIGLIGFIGFPLYYWVWKYLFPQPYENLTLRLIGSALFFGLLTSHQWPAPYKKYLKIYWVFTLLYSSSFFFTFMLLKNEGNFVWAMSMMAGLTLLILVAYDWMLVTIIFISGSLLAVICALGINQQESISIENYLIQIPIYLFMVIAGSALNYKASVNRQEQLKILASVGAEITHELRTPLLSIQHNGKKIQSAINTLDAQQHKELHDASRNISNETHYANTIIDMLLMNLRGKDVNTTQFSLHSTTDIIHTAIKRYPFRSQQEKDTINIQKGSEFTIWGSDILLVHILFNLIKNALSHTDKSGAIYISSHTDKQYNRLVFKDTGKGISAKKLPYIFDDFYTTSECGAGTGVGLSFCKNAMKQMNGKINCHSVFGEFTQFTLSFPITSAHHAHHHATTPTIPLVSIEKSRDHLKAKNILLIDDEDIHHILFDENLETCKANIFHAFSSDSALRLLNENSIDCIVIDIHMPGMNGIELTQHIRKGRHLKQYSTIPIIGVSSDPSEQVETHARTHGMNAFLRKPTKAHSLIAILSHEIMRSPVAQKAIVNTHNAALSNTSPLYQLGAKLTHDMNTPITTLSMCNKAFSLLFPALLNAYTCHKQHTTLSNDCINTLSQAPAFYHTAAQNLRTGSDQFWQAFKVANTATAQTLITHYIDTLQQQWLSIEQHNHAVLSTLLPTLVEACNQQNLYDDSLENTHDMADLSHKVTTSADNCIHSTRHAQQVITDTQQELSHNMNYTDE
jgi:two-component system CAI-1 autoinducer sensor kinase/phosphatase CqsS